MTRLKFCYFMDYEDGKMARLETTGEMEIPVNIFIDNAAELGNMQEGICSIDIYGMGGDLSVYPSEEAFEKSGTKMAPVSMIPMGTFPAKEDDEDFQQSPHILFSGRVIDVDRNPSAGLGKPNYCLLVETVEISLHLYVRYDQPVEKGNIIQGVAWLFGDLEPVEASDDLGL